MGKMHNWYESRVHTDAEDDEDDEDEQMYGVNGWRVAQIVQKIYPLHACGSDVVAWNEMNY